MGFRSRLKAAVAKRLGGESRPTEPPRPPTAPARPTPSPASAPPAAASKPAPAKPAPAKPAPAKPAPAKPDIDPEMAAKAAKHFEKARRAVLKFVVDQGGVADMGAMHDYSERRYFIAHRRFSDLMEGIVGEGLITYDDRAGEATITDAGQAYIAD